MRAHTLWLSFSASSRLGDSAAPILNDDGPALIKHAVEHLRRLLIRRAVAILHLMEPLPSFPSSSIGHTPSKVSDFFKIFGNLSGQRAIGAPVPQPPG